MSGKAQRHPLTTKETHTLSTLSGNTARPRDRRSHVRRLTVDLPKGTFSALKIHAIQRETTIREFVTDLIERAVSKAGADA